MANNWTNHLVIKAIADNDDERKEIIQQVKEKCFTVNKKDLIVFDLEKILPTPELDDKPNGTIMPNWWWWRIENWGTKWNAYYNKDFSMSEDTIDTWFCTANGTIIPIINKICNEMFKCKISLTLEYANEDWGNGCGIFEYDMNDDKFIYTGKDLAWVFDFLKLGEQGFYLADNRVMDDYEYNEWLKQNHSDIKE